MTQQEPTTYRVEFGPAWPVPPITIDFTDRDAAARQIAEHAIPHLRPVLAEKGRPELADCFFHFDEDGEFGQFVYFDLAGGKGARFCPARLTAVEDVDDDVCGDLNDDEVCTLEPGHDGDHLNGYATVGWPNAATP
ncbi:hypothetical protein AAW14_06205 [Streptomyces hygroscopicus]|uniref:hypothetical protein n=1 Tax=Streptomyces hygroscopicus TaxID=1912 RepID=UPI00223EF873|nr:hypothetical protein [Streptomyces hygroscopicus]MCW7941635.1 hypothetical protein [Streptomyces hygroscopicus]